MTKLLMMTALLLTSACRGGDKAATGASAIARQCLGKRETNRPASGAKASTKYLKLAG